MLRAYFATATCQPSNHPEGTGGFGLQGNRGGLMEARGYAAGGRCVYGQAIEPGEWRPEAALAC